MQFLKFYAKMVRGDLPGTRHIRVAGLGRLLLMNGFLNVVEWKASR